MHTRHTPTPRSAEGQSGGSRITRTSCCAGVPAAGHHPADRQRLEELLAGDNPGYPEQVLAAAQAQVRHRLNRMRTVTVQAGAFAEHTIQAVRYIACQNRSWLGSLYDYGHGEPIVTERHACA